MDHNEVDRLTNELEAEFGDRVEHDALRLVVSATFDRYQTASIKDFVPVFVEREMRRSLQSAR